MYKEKTIRFKDLDHPVVVYALHDHEGLAVGVKTLTADGKMYSVATSSTKVEPEPTEQEFVNFYNVMLGDATEYSQDLRSAALDIQTRTSEELLAFLFDTDFTIKEQHASKLYH